MSEIGSLQEEIQQSHRTG